MCILVRAATFPCCPYGCIMNNGDLPYIQVAWRDCTMAMHVPYAYPAQETDPFPMQPVAGSPRSAAPKSQMQHQSRCHPAVITSPASHILTCCNIKMLKVTSVGPCVLPQACVHSSGIMHMEADISGVATWRSMPLSLYVVG